MAEQSRGGFLRNNVFMVAAVSLPVLVAGLFILASAVPRWTVPPPTYDLLLKTTRPYTQPPATVLVDFNVRNGRVEATLSAPVPNGYAQQWALLLFDHETMNVEEVAIDLPAAMAQGEPPRTIVVDSLTARRVSAQTTAPDGYELQTRSSGSPGIVGDLFGMGRYRQTAALVNRGRVVAIDLPSPYGDPYQSPVSPVGWILDGGRAEVDVRQRALDEIVTLARQHDLSGVEIAAALGEHHAATAEGRRRGVMVRVLGFIGGTFVFAGVGVFIALQWDSMNSAARVIITLGSGVSAFIAAVLSTREARFDKATTPLFLMAAALQPTGMLVAFDEFGSGGDWRLASLATCGTMALQFAGTFRTIARSTLLFMCILFGTLFWWTLFDILNADDAVVAIVIGGSLLLASIGVDRTPHRVMTPLWYLLGSTGFLYGVFDSVEGTPLEIGFLIAAAGFVYLSVTLHSRTLLFVATAAILAYTGWFTGEHFADSVGWPIALIIFGLFMIGLSALAFRIDRDYVRVSPAGLRE